jgi:hypothetical protein
MEAARVNLVIRDSDDTEHASSVKIVGKLFKISFQYTYAKTECQLLPHYCR